MRIISFLAGAIVLFLITAVIIYAYYDIKCCERYEQKQVHHLAWIETIPAIKGTVSVYHPAKDSFDNVCVEYKPKCGGWFLAGK